MDADKRAARNWTRSRTEVCNGNRLLELKMSRGREVLLPIERHREADASKSLHGGRRARGC